MKYNALSDRNTSSFPLSIGTGLAFESLFSPREAPYDSSRMVPNKVNLKKYNDVFINVFTLYRNLVGSMKSIDVQSTSIEDLADTLRQEIDVIYSLFDQEGNDIIKPIFYTMTYQDVWVGSWCKSAIVKHPKTILQQDFYNRYRKLIKKLDDLSINRYNSTLNEKTRGSVLIHTHMPIDLIDYGKYKSMDLLESNTGRLKTPNTWSTKYAKVNGEYINNIPFNKMLLVVFGDRVIINPYPNVIRNEILKIAKDSNWTAATTEAKIRLDLKVKLQDPFLITTLMRI